MTPLVFRRLILIWWVLLIVSIVGAGVTESYFFPPELSNYQESVAARELTVFDGLAIALAVPISIGLIVGSIGSYNFKPWARTLFLWSNLLSLVPSFLSGASIETGFTSFFASLDMLLTGGLLFTMYLPPIGDIFDKHISSPKATDL